MAAQASRHACVLVMAKLLARDRGDAGRCLSLPRTRSLTITVSESTAISCPHLTVAQPLFGRAVLPRELLSQGHSDRGAYGAIGAGQLHADDESVQHEI